MEELEGGPYFSSQEKYEALVMIRSDMIDRELHFIELRKNGADSEGLQKFWRLKRAIDQLSPRISKSIEQEEDGDLLEDMISDSVNELENLILQLRSLVA